MTGTRIVLVALLGITAGCAEKKPAERPPQFDPGPTPEEFVTGEALFNQNCAGCHGVRGGGSEQGPPLVHLIYEPNHHADEAFRRAVALGVVPHHWGFGPMPAQPTVSPGQIEEIIRYVRWLQRKAGIT